MAFILNLFSKQSVKPASDQSGCTNMDSSLEIVRKQETGLYLNSDNPLVRLPLEIQFEIFLQLDEASSKNNNNNPPLKILRLVSKYFRDLITPSLFHTIVLYEHPARWTSLNNIAKHPELAKHVKQIQLASIPQLLNLTKEEYEQCDPAAEHGSMRIYPPNGGPLALLDHVSLEKRYARYRSWRDAEATFWNNSTDKQTPQLEAQNFGPLDIETIGMHELSVVKRLGRPTPVTRRHAETGVCDYHHGPPVTPSHLYRFIHAASGNITRLALHSIHDIIQPYCDVELPNLRFLMLDLHLRNCGNSYLPKPKDHRKLAVWLQGKAIPNLEELVVIQYVETENAANVLELFQQTHFPGLARVHLVSPETTYTALYDFTMRHLDTIKQFRVDYPIMKPADWYKFVAKIRDAEVLQETRYAGKIFELDSSAIWKFTMDPRYEDRYWDERWKRPQDRQRLNDLAGKVNSSGMVQLA